MKVLTLKEPWATLIASGRKEYEFRSFKTNYRGLLLIHAGKSVDNAAKSRFEDWNLEYKNGRIVCLVEVLDCIKVDDEMRVELKKIEPKIYKPVIDGWEGYAWKIRLVQLIDDEKIHKGKLGIWNLEYHI